MKLEDQLSRIDGDSETLERVLQFMEEQRKTTYQRQREGIERARLRGVKFGRPRVEIKNVERLYQRFREGQLSVSEAAKLTGVPRSTVYRRFCECADRERNGSLGNSDF